MASAPARRTVGLLAPMRSELAPLARVLRLRPHEHPSGAFRAGHTASARLVASLAEIGTARAAASTTRLLDEFDVDHVVVVGIAGSVDASLAIGELVVPEVVMDWRTGREHEPWPLGDLRARGGLVTSDELLYEPDTLESLRRRGVVAVDMETSAVADVCERRGVPWSVVRAISDRAADGPILVEGAMAMIDAQGTPRPAAVVRYLARRPRRIPHLFRLRRGSRLAARTAAAAVSRAV